MPLPALLVEPHPAPAPLPEVVPAAASPNTRAHPREAVEHHREQRPVPEPGQRARVNRLEELPHLRRREVSLSLPFVTTCFGPRTAARNLADDEPVAEHADPRPGAASRRTAGTNRGRAALPRRRPRPAVGDAVPHVSPLGWEHINLILGIPLAGHPRTTANGSPTGHTSRQPTAHGRSSPEGTAHDTPSAVPPPHPPPSDRWLPPPPGDRMPRH